MIGVEYDRISLTTIDARVLEQVEPDDGFEPSTFALQEHCSGLAELIRLGDGRDPVLLRPGVLGHHRLSYSIAADLEPQHLGRRTPAVTAKPPNVVGTAGRAAVMRRARMVTSVALGFRLGEDQFRPIRRVALAPYATIHGAGDQIRTDAYSLEDCRARPLTLHPHGTDDGARTRTPEGTA